MFYQQNGLLIKRIFNKPIATNIDCRERIMLYTIRLHYRCNGRIIQSKLSRYLRYTNRISMLFQDGEVFLTFDDNDNYVRQFIIDLPNYVPEICSIDLNNNVVDTEKNMSISLEISHRKDITIFSKELLHMQLPFFNEEYNPWFYSHFINIYYCPDGFMNYPDERRFSDIFEIKNIGFEAFAGMNSKESFVHSIQKGFYIHIWVDNFWVSNSVYYNRYHDVHPVLIYGYDLNKNTYKCARFEMQKALECIDIPIDELHTAVESAKIYFYIPTEEPFKLMKLKKLYGKYQNSKGRFLSELRDYRNGVGSREYSYFVHNTVMSPNKEFFGISVTQCFIDGLKQPGLYNLFDYRMLHLIIENKRLILNAMKYHNRYGVNIPEINSIISQYESIVQKYERQRMLYIKQSSVESDFNGFYTPPKDENTIIRMTNTISELLEFEKNLLDEYLPLAEKKFVLYREYDLGMPIAFSTNEFTTGDDNNGRYYEIVFDKPVLIGDIEIYDPAHLFDGKIIVNDVEHECFSKDAVYDFLHIKNDVSKTRTIRYYPKVSAISKGNPLIFITAFKPNVLFNSKITASSIFSEAPSISFDPYNVLTPADTDDGWTCECSDKERFLRFDLKEPKRVAAFSMSQLKLEQRILAYSVEFYTKSGECVKTIRYEGDMESKPTYHKFEEITASYIIVRILKTKVDDNGYDIPRITNISVY